VGSVIFTEILQKLVKADTDFDTVTVKVMLTNTYTPNVDTHVSRADVTPEVTGAGYTAGGAAVGTITITKDTANDRVDITLPGYTWTSSTITANRANYYVSRGGASSADELLASIDVGTVTSTNGNWALTASTFRLQNNNVTP
jgi:hypothetical protein